MGSDDDVTIARPISFTCSGFRSWGLGASVKGLGFRVYRAVVEPHYKVAIILRKDLRLRV